MSWECGKCKKMFHGGINFVSMHLCDDCLKSCAILATDKDILMDLMEKADNAIASLHNAVDWVRQHIKPVGSQLAADGRAYHSVQNRVLLDLYDDIKDAELDVKEYYMALEKLKERK